MGMVAQAWMKVGLEYRARPCQYKTIQPNQKPNPAILELKTPIFKSFKNLISVKTVQSILQFTSEVYTACFNRKGRKTL